MKYKTTAKALRGEPNTFKCGYCALQHLLTYRNPVAYTCGVYGWNFDVYEVYGVTITTGYRGMVGKQIDYDKVRLYEQAAERIVYSREIAYDDKPQKLEKLLEKFCAELKEGRC